MKNEVTEVFENVVLGATFVFEGNVYQKMDEPLQDENPTEDEPMPFPNHYKGMWNATGVTGVRNLGRKAVVKTTTDRVKSKKYYKAQGATK